MRPMSISVSQSVKDGYMTASDYILYGEYIDGCSKGALSYTIKKVIQDKLAAKASKKFSNLPPTVLITE
jgi:hypothetical protein